MDLYVNWMFKFNFSSAEIAETSSNNYWNEILRWYIFSFLRGPGIPVYYSLFYALKMMCIPQLFQGLLTVRKGVIYTKQ